MKTASRAPLRPRHLSLPVSALLLGTSLTAPMAHADEEAPAQLEPITVQATPFARTADEIIQPVEVLAGRELDRKRKSTIGETLEGELGVSSSDFGPGVGRPLIRGQGGPRVSVLENGISSMDVSNVSSDHAVGIDPSNAEQVEIIKGPATLMFGNGASAGVVNLVNNRLPTEFTAGLFGSTDFSFSSNAEEQHYAADLNYGVNGWMLHFDGAQRNTGDLDIPGFADPANPANEGTLPNSSVDARSGAVSVSRIGEGGSFGLAVSRFMTRYGLPQETEAFIDLDQTRVDAQARLNAPVQGLESLSLRLGTNSYAHTEFEDPVTPGTSFDNDELELRLEARHLPLAGYKGAFGLQAIYRDFSAIGDEAFVQPVETQSIGAFLVEERPFAWGRIEMGARVDVVDNTPATLRSDGTPNVDPRTGTPLQSRQHTPVSLSFGTLYNLDPKHHLRLGLTRAERAPVAEELYAFGPHLATGTFERGNGGFGKEVANNIDLTLDRHDDRLTWKFSLYYNRLSDYLYLQELDANLDADNTQTGPDADGIADGEIDRVNEDGEFVAPANLAGDELVLVDYLQSDAEFYGFEGEVGYGLLVEGPFKLNARVFGDLVRGELKGGGNLPRVTPSRYGLGMEASQGDFSGELTYTRVEEQSRISTLETPTAGFNLLSLDLGYTVRLAGGALASTVYLRGRNLLDEEARRHTSFIKDVVPQAGRALILGVRSTF